MISSDKLLLRKSREAFTIYGFKPTYNAGIWTSVLMKRDDDCIGLTCLDSRDRLNLGRRQLIDFIVRHSEEMFRDIKVRSIFIVPFVLLDPEICTAAHAGVSVVQADDLPGLVEILDLSKGGRTDFVADQIRLAAQMFGMCRRFAQASQVAGDLQGAVTWRLRQSALKPTAAEPHWALAELQSKVGSLDEAETSAGQLLQLSPGNLSVLLLLMDIKRRRGNLRGATEVANILTACFPDDLIVRKRVAALVVHAAQQ